VKEEIMSEEKNVEVDILDEYDFSNAVIGKYEKQYGEFVANIFPQHS